MAWRLAVRLVLTYVNKPFFRRSCRPPRLQHSHASTPSDSPGPVPQNTSDCAQATPARRIMQELGSLFKHEFIRRAPTAPKVPQEYGCPLGSPERGRRVLADSLKDAGTGGSLRINGSVRMRGRHSRPMG